MGLFDGLKKKATEAREAKAVDQYFKLLTAYSPAYTSYQGSVYEMALTRAAIHAFATHCGKLQPKIVGSARKDLERILQYKPNQLMDTYTFLYKIATILATENTAFIVPLYGQNMRISGFYPLRSQGTEVKVINGVQYLIYESPLGDYQRMAIELAYVGVMRNHAYKSDLYGEANSALDSTLNLMHTNEQGIINGVRNSANIRFIARLASVLLEKDISKERRRFSEENLSADNNGGVLLVDSKYADVKEIRSTQLLIDDKQAALINANVYNYLGVNEDILQNKYSEDTWNAYYEGKIEPFAIQLSLVMTNMVFRDRQLANSNSIMFEANRLQYASNTTKINIVTQLFDRGFITHNAGLEIFNMAPVDGGDRRWIRREYIEVDKIGAEEVTTSDNPGDQAVPAIQI